MVGSDVDSYAQCSQLLEQCLTLELADVVPTEVDRFKMILLSTEVEQHLQTLFGEVVAACYQCLDSLVLLH